MSRRTALILPALFVLTLVGIALAAPLLDLANPVRQDMANRLAGALAGSPLGRDEFGRDVLSRLIWGARTSLFVAFTAAAIACVLGTTLGLIGGWFKGIGAFVAIRSAEIILCFPPILLALLVVTLLGPGAGTLILVISILYLPGFVRVAYAQVLATRAMDYVEAARALGLPTYQILLKTILPTIAGPVLVQLSLAVAAAIVLESGLSFLGLGVVPPSPSWGLMIRGARSTMEQAPMLLLWPCLALTLTILAINLLCDALRDWVDPRSSAGPKLRLIDRVVPGLLPPSIPDATLEVRDLTVEITTPAGLIRPVDGVSLHLAPGETLALVGESGSGKSLTATAVMGLLPPEARPFAVTVAFVGRDLFGMAERERRALRGDRIAMIFQDPMSSLNPVMRVGEQVVEAIRAHRPVSAKAARAEALALFRRVGIADPEARLDAFAHELSGGMRQRAMIAIALANRPQLIIADEPTTALDVTVQAQIVELLAELQRETGAALVFITHNLGLVAEIADRVAVMYAGQVVEQGPVAEVFTSPRHPYTAALIAAVPEPGRDPVGIPGVVPQPHAWPSGCRFAPRCRFAAEACGVPVGLVETGSRAVRCVRADTLGALAPPAPRAAEREAVAGASNVGAPLVVARSLTKTFHRAGFFRQGPGVQAVAGVDLTVHRGEALGVVGESGSGKSTIGRLLLGLIPPTSGTVQFEGRDLTTLAPTAWRAERRHMQIVFQDPFGSLDPRRRVGAQIEDGLRLHGLCPPAERAAKVRGLLERVGLDPAYASRFPHEFSGGQRQRIGIARALAVEPRFLVADEPVSALDVSIQAQIVELLSDLRRDLGLALLFISHDLPVVRQLCDRVVVLYLGRVMEVGPAATVLDQPRHPYTQALASATPRVQVADRRQRILLPGDPPSPASPPSGCVFRTRCAFATDLCATTAPPLEPAADGRLIACHHWQALTP